MKANVVEILCQVRIFTFTYRGAIHTSTGLPITMRLSGEPVVLQTNLHIRSGREMAGAFRESRFESQMNKLGAQILFH